MVSCGERKRGVCGQMNCALCWLRSFAAFSDSAKVSAWSDQNSLQPSQVVMNHHDKFYFNCTVCLHTFKTGLNKVTKGRWCSFCAGVKLCKDNECGFCFQRSLASFDTEKMKCFSSNNNLSPRQISKGSKITVYFDCKHCNHEFGIMPNTLTDKRKVWCGYCGNQRLCEKPDCIFCFNRSLASFDPEKIYWFSSNNQLTPRQISRNSKKNTVYFDCWRCGHEFEIQPTNLVSGNNWCGFCAGKHLCDESNCETCHERSFASHDAAKVQCWDDSKQNEGWQPRDILKASHEKFWFKCNRCPHSFQTSISNITGNNSWCPYCCNTICGQSDCTWCKKPCVNCLLVDIKTVGQRQTPDGLMCTACYKISPHCTPSQRAKISLEMQTIHALHDQIDKTPGGFVFRELTTWDCAVLPGVNFKPDLMWAYDSEGNCFETTGQCKIEEKAVSHIVILEVLEHGKQQHSDARDIPDADRETQTREALLTVPIFYVYMSIANNTYHHGAHPEDVFFTKNNNDSEYSLIPERKKAWRNRIVLLLDILMTARQKLSNDTVWIGY